MTTEVWSGNKWPPQSASEQQALLDIYNYLQGQDDLFLMLAQFNPPSGNEIDLMIVKANAIFLVEQKHVGGKLRGGVEGKWIVIDPDGSETSLPRNPFTQIKQNYWALNKWFEDTAPKISQGLARAEPPDYRRSIFSYIVITPTLQLAQPLNLPNYVTAVGLKEFLPALITRARQGFELTSQEMHHIPILLNLKERKYDLPRETIKMEGDWHPEPFAVLVVRGNHNSAPLFKLDSFNKEIITIGRASDNDLVIDESTISSHHAKIHATQGRYVVEDCDSKNGTYISYKVDPQSEMQLKKNVPNAIKNNSIIRFGTISFTFLEHRPQNS